MEIDRSKPVLVTGANGYIASWIVKYLLEDGVDVQATVRNPDDEAKVGHLLRIAAKAKGRLRLFKADLLDASGFDAAMAGCGVVIHTASPFVIKGIRDPQRELVEPAVAGTRHVLEAANRTPSVRRVVLTSSVAAIYGDSADLAGIPGGRFTEAHWNTSSSLTHQPYSYSKLLAERTAWEIAQAQSRWDLVTINPGFVLGPSLTRASDSTSLQTIRELADGTYLTGVPMIEFGMVDVRDVALAHVRAAFTPTAAGRHIAVAESKSMPRMVETLKRHFGRGYRWPLMVAPKFAAWLIGPLNGVTRAFIARNVGHPVRFDNDYIQRDLGLRFRSCEQTLVDHFQQMIDDGVVPKPCKLA